VKASAHAGEITRFGRFGHAGLRNSRPMRLKLAGPGRLGGAT
jgi:hypothetical protein